MTLPKIYYVDESQPVIASDDWAINRVRNHLYKVSLDCHAASLHLMATAGRQLAMTHSRCWEPLMYYKGLFNHVLNKTGSLRYITRRDDGDIGHVIASDCEAIQSTKRATKNSKQRTA